MVKYSLCHIKDSIGVTITIQLSLSTDLVDPPPMGTIYVYETCVISAINKSIILMFSVNLPLVFIYKFRKKGNSDPTSRKISRRTSKRSSTRNIEI